MSRRLRPPTRRPDPRSYALVVGIREVQDLRQQQLQYSERDAEPSTRSSSAPRAATSGLRT